MLGLSPYLNKESVYGLPLILFYLYKAESLKKAWKNVVFEKLNFKNCIWISEEI